MNEKILLVDDDQTIRTFIKKDLTEHHYEVLEAGDGVEALEVLAQQSIDLAIVDVMMPNMDGYELCEEVRSFYDIPVLMVTAKSELQDKTKGFLAGTDDYVTKPFEPKELLFRIRALLRRYQKEQQEAIQVGNVIIDTLSYEIRLHQSVLMMPLKEFELLHYLAAHPNRTFTREQMIERVWGIDFDGDERTVDVHIKRLRSRFKEKNTGFTIQTVRSVGYKLEVHS